MFEEKDFFLQTTYYVVCILGIKANLITMLMLRSSANLRRKPIIMFIIYQCFIVFTACALTLGEEIVTEQGADN